MLSKAPPRPTPRDGAASIQLSAGEAADEALADEGATSMPLKAPRPVLGAGWSSGGSTDCRCRGSAANRRARWVRFVALLFGKYNLTV